MSNEAVLAHFQVEGNPLTVIEYKGQPVFPCSQVSTAIGYSRANKLADNITQRWADEFIEGVHYIRLNAAEIAAFRNLDTGLVSTSQAFLLTEPGANLACLKAKTKQGRKVRAVLSEDVMPSLRKTGTYTVPGVQPVAPVQPVPVTLTHADIIQIATAAALAAVQAMPPHPAVQITTAKPEEGPTPAPDGYRCVAELRRDLHRPTKVIQAAIRQIRKRLLVFGSLHASKYQRRKDGVWHYSPAEVEAIKVALGIDPEAPTTVFDIQPH